MSAVGNRPVLPATHTASVRFQLLNPPTADATRGTHNHFSGAGELSLPSIDALAIFESKFPNKMHLPRGLDRRDAGSVGFTYREILT